MAIIVDLLNIVNILFPLIILIVALYMYFTIEKETKTLLLGLGFLFFFLYSLEVAFGVLGGLVPLLDDNASMWPPLLLLIGYCLLLAMIEPWKLMKKE